MSLFSLNQSRLLIFLLSAGLLFVFIESCRKMDKPQVADLQKEKFFRIHSTTDPLVKAIAANIRRQDDKRNLTGKLIAKAGFPVWDKAQISKGGNANRIAEGETQVFIPFINEDEQETKAVLAVKVKGADTLFTMVYGAGYRQYGFDTTANTGKWSARDVFGVFTYFDHVVFGRSEFYVGNSRLFGTATDTIATRPVKVYIDNTSSSQARLQRTNPGSIIVYVTYVYCQYPNGNRIVSPSSRQVYPNCYNATYVQQQVTFHLDENLPGGGYFDDGGGGGGNGFICVGCSWEDTNPCNLDPMAPQEPCFDDWQPVEDAVAEPYNPYNADTIGISDVIRDSFPCLYSFLKDSIQNPNLIAQLAGTDLFSDSAYFHLQFDISTTRTTGSDITAHTESSRPGYFGGRVHHLARVYFNPWYLKNGTKELMIATIIHECMHAIFILRWKQYQAWLLDNTENDIDSNFIKTHFPLHWNYLAGIPFTQAQQHQIMGTDYYHRFDSIMRQWYNPNAATAIRDTVIKALAYSGMSETAIWKMLPSMGMDTCKYKGMVNAAERSGTGNGYPPGCPSSSFHYANDLKLRPSCN